MACCRFSAKLIAVFTAAVLITTLTSGARPVQADFSQQDDVVIPTGAGGKIFLPIVPKSISPVTTGGRSYYVAANANSSGNGSQSAPWSLQTALNQPSTLRPGDTVWVRGGTYRGKFTSHLKGSSSAPITVRAYPGEWVTLDAPDVGLVIADTYYVNFWGLEITNSATQRTVSSSPGRNDGVQVEKASSSHHIKFINMLVHDLGGQGFSWWDSNTDSEIYGSLIYFNGASQLDHGIYTQNQTGRKTMSNNFIFDNASHGISAYGSSTAYINNFTIQGNTLFNNGSIGFNPSTGLFGRYARNILVGGGRNAQNPVIDSNYSYIPAAPGTTLNLGFDVGSSNAKVTGNYLMNGNVVFAGNNSGMIITGNTVFAASLAGINTSSYPNNTWRSSKPGGVQIFVQPNLYEPGRANLTIFNWDKAGTVQVSASQLSGVQIQAGDRYELRNVQNYSGDVVTGTYNGSAIQVPMTGHSVARPNGLSIVPASTFPEFGAFVLVVKR